MRTTRRLYLFGVMVLAVMAVTVEAASAQTEILGEPSGEHCGEVVLIGGHETSGGCHVEFESENDVAFFAYIPAKTLIMNCELHLDAYIGESGEGFVTNVVFTDPPSQPGACTRRPCDEANGNQLTWPIHIRENAGVESMELAMCIRTAASGPGGAQALCTVHLALSEASGHHFEIGTGSETFSEVSPFPFPVSFQIHLESEEGVEEVAIVH